MILTDVLETPDYVRVTFSALREKPRASRGVRGFLLPTYVPACMFVASPSQPRRNRYSAVGGLRGPAVRQTPFQTPQCDAAVGTALDACPTTKTSSSTDRD